MFLALSTLREGSINLIRRCFIVFGLGDCQLSLVLAVYGHMLLFSAGLESGAVQDEFGGWPFVGL